MIPSITWIPLKVERKSRGGRMSFDTLIYAITKYHKQRKRFIVSKATKNKIIFDDNVNEKTK